MLPPQLEAHLPGPLAGLGGRAPHHAAQLPLLPALELCVPAPVRGTPARRCVTPPPPPQPRFRCPRGGCCDTGPGKVAPALWGWVLGVPGCLIPPPPPTSCKDGTLGCSPTPQKWHRDIWVPPPPPFKDGARVPWVTQGAPHPGRVVSPSPPAPKNGAPLPSGEGRERGVANGKGQGPHEYARAHLHAAYLLRREPLQPKFHLALAAGGGGGGWRRVEACRSVSRRVEAWRPPPGVTRVPLWPPVLSRGRLSRPVAVPGPSVPVPGTDPVLTPAGGGRGKGGGGGGKEKRGGECVLGCPGGALLTPPNTLTRPAWEGSGCPVSLPTPRTRGAGFWGVPPQKRGPRCALFKG
ncbi:nascent polypeptide-associated complex subunit alpha, muscle-specific form-like [Cygnus olor]|uniref:nascent polypeptide-associated complex subunit alpha, muscle-specific form-like n=1 Tax=Cygnus olor TaxID=8869 RepID=UPI001ADEB17A|nr:nascent polypeptide-associated complex subunit alpha, muscle-specific form-like [Cygnus olor]